MAEEPHWAHATELRQAFQDVAALGQGEGATIGHVLELLVSMASWSGYCSSMRPSSPLADDGVVHADWNHRHGSWSVPLAWSQAMGPWVHIPP